MRKIKQLQSLILSAIALGTLIIVPAAMAAPSTNSGGGSTNTVKKPESSPETSPEATETPADIAERTTRIEKEKGALKIKLDAKETLLIKTKCKPAQIIVKAVGSNTEQKVKDRTKAYGEIIDRLNGIVVKLKAKNVDTTDLEKEITALQALVTKFTTDLAAYKVAMVNLKAIDCVTSPDAFKEALEKARTANGVVLKDAADIKAYIKATIKPTLEKIRSTLEASEKASSNESSTNSTTKTGAN